MKTLCVVLLGASLMGCAASEPVDLLEATMSPTAAMVAGLSSVREACPSLATNKGRFRAGLVTEGTPSLTAEREFSAAKTVTYTLAINVPSAGQVYDVGEECSYEVALGKGGGLIASKVACINLCDADAQAPDGFYVKKL